MEARVAKEIGRGGVGLVKVNKRGLFVPLPSPIEIWDEFPITPVASETVLNGRKQIHKIINGEDDRLLVITGPCSIHDEAAAMNYAERLVRLKEKVEETLMLVMRVYFEKPRTTVGWKGMMNDPHLDGTRDVMTGIRKAREILLAINEMGLPVATEFLDPVSALYISDLVSWGCIGARTTESQTHREMASGLPVPVGFKNGTDGGLDTAVNAMIAAGSPQSFLGIDPHGRAGIVNTDGNPNAHIVLRGGTRPNYDSVSIRMATEQLRKKGLCEAVVVDCSHANSWKQYRNQLIVWQDVINQRIDGNDAIVGLMLESNLKEGNQKNTGDLSTMEYGVSITDACISWGTTKNLLLSAHKYLMSKKN